MHDPCLTTQIGADIANRVAEFLSETGGLFSRSRVVFHSIEMPVPGVEPSHRADVREFYLPAISHASFGLTRWSNVHYDRLIMGTRLEQTCRLGQSSLLEFQAASLVLTPLMDCYIYVVP